MGVRSTYVDKVTKINCKSPIPYQNLLKFFRTLLGKKMTQQNDTTYILKKTPVMLPVRENSAWQFESSGKTTSLQRTEI